MEHQQGSESQKLSLHTFIQSPLGEIVFLTLIFSLAFLIRRIGLKFGSPFLTHPDEWAIVEPAFSMTQNRTLDSNQYIRPDQITQLLNFFYLNVLNLIKTGKDISATLPGDKFPLYYASRVMIAVFGSLIPIIAYKIGKEGKINFSVPAALLFAFFPVYVLHSHFVTPDIPVTFFTLLIILFSLRYVRSKNTKYLYLATFFAAVNTAEKYPGLISFGIVVFSILWVQNEKYSKQPLRILKNACIESLKFFGFYVFFLYIVAPNLFINYGEVIENIKTEARSTHAGSDGLGWLGNMGFYIHNFYRYANFGVALFILAGIAGMFITKNYVMLFGFYGMVYWVILSKLALHWERWALPMYTFPLLLAAFGFAFLWHTLKSNRVPRTVVGAAFCLAIVGLVMQSFSLSIRYAYTNTTVAAYQYCQDFGIHQDDTLYEGYTPFSPSSNSFIDLSLMMDETEYIILSSGAYGRFYNEPDRYADRILIYEQIRRENVLLKEFVATEPASNIPLLAWADDMWYYASLHLGATPSPRFSGPTIEIYRINR